MAHRRKKHVGVRVKHASSSSKVVTVKQVAGGSDPGVEANSNQRIDQSISHAFQQQVNHFVSPRDCFPESSSIYMHVNIRKIDRSIDQTFYCSLFNLTSKD
jgi:Ribonuclease G/E